jgi:hypothetical protein
VHLDVVEHEAPAVEVDDDALRVRRAERPVEAAADAVRVDVADLGDLLAGLQGSDPHRLDAVGLQVVLGGVDRRGAGTLLDRATGLGEQHHDPLPLHQGVEADGDRRRDAEVDALVGHVHGVAVADRSLALDAEQRLALRGDEVEVDR